MVDSRLTGVDHVEEDGSGGSSHVEGSATRRRILHVALTLMAQRGVDGTSMRDLAAAVGLNVASLYHYFPSKRDLLESVLVEHGYLPLRTPRPVNGVGEVSSPANLAELLADILVSVFAVEDFVRLMAGEAMRGETTARAVGFDLFSSFESSVEEWVAKHRPDLAARSGAGAVARLVSALVVGTFIQHAAGVLNSSDDLTELSVRRAREAADLLRPPD